MIGANFTDHFGVFRAADGSHFRAQRLGDLHCERADAASSTVDQHVLRRLNIAFPKTLERGTACRRNRSSFLKREVHWLQRHCVFPRYYEFGERAEPTARDISKDFIAALELCYVPANSFNSPCDVVADDFAFRIDQTRDQAKWERRSPEKR